MDLQNYLNFEYKKQITFNINTKILFSRFIRLYYSKNLIFVRSFLTLCEK